MKNPAVSSNAKQPLVTSPINPRQPFNFKKNVLPHVLAVLLFLALTAAYVAPILFENKSLVQNDILQSKGGSKEIQDYRDKHNGQEPLWTNSMFSGMPAYLITARFPGDLSYIFHNAFTLGMPAVAANIFLTLVCAYILFVVMGMSTWLAIAGSFAMTFTSYNLVILAAGHNTKSLAIAYIPLALAGLLYAFRKGNRRLWLGAALFTFGLAMHIRSNHMQITYYLLLLVLIFGIVYLIDAVKNGWLPDFLKRVVVLGICAIIAAGVSFGRLYTTAEYTKYSIRGKSELKAPNSGTGQSTGLDRDYAFNWSYGVGETMTLLVPNFYGGASVGSLSKNSETAKAMIQNGIPEVQVEEYLKSFPLYWGDQPGTSGPVYVGAIVCFLFVLGLFVVEKRMRYWLLAGTILSILLSWGKNFPAFNYFMFDYFPAYNKFRAVSMTLVIAQITMPLLGIFALYRFLYKGDVKEPQKKLLYAAAITGGICLLVFLFAGMGSFSNPNDERSLQQAWLINAVRADRAGMMRGDAIRSLIFIALAAGALYFYLRNKLAVTSAVILIAFLILIDLWTVDKRYLNNDNFQTNLTETHFEPTPADQSILQDKDLSYRVLNLGDPFNEARTSYFHKSIGGYHGAKMRRYADIIEQHIAQNNIKVLNMLNTRYFITGDQQQPVQRNPQALGNAWFVQKITKVNSPDEELAALKAFDPATEAVVDVSKFPVKQTQYSATGSTVKLTSYEPNDLKYDVSAAQEGLIVFSEIYYPEGWQAYLDGKPVEHIRANYVLRAMPVPAGKHTIEFKFEPASYSLGNTGSLISSILMILIIIGGIVYAVKSEKEELKESAR
ncbi:YfhO family protein [Adhaeribacter radiodurans]|uniref:YfhO family protein n=1 Tax=Adhaeribacter radiodurans TaxID=2745197 RepID=A0A7L7LDF8_9BACT|nr:YfhO family protein [Adhaeribacter radiodurans]QMU30813.1 YfhO family protein [Adhaeribacter radiodurans]